MANLNWNKIDYSNNIIEYFENMVGLTKKKDQFREIYNLPPDGAVVVFKTKSNKYVLCTNFNVERCMHSFGEWMAYREWLRID